jgi:hypothetical protein
VGDPVRVAGRPAHQLVLTPRAEGTLVESVRIAVDAADRVPTRVQVFAVGHEAPALEVGFTSLSLVPPAADTVTFTPPPGATVEEVDLTQHPADADGQPSGLEGHDLDGSGKPGVAAEGERPVTVVGDGWASVLVATLPPGALESLTAGVPASPGAGGTDGPGDAPFGPGHGNDDDAATSAAAQAALLLDALPAVEGPWGSGRLLTSRLLSVLVTDDGRVLLGAVDRATLEAAAAAPGPTG